MSDGTNTPRSAAKPLWLTVLKWLVIPVLVGVTVGIANSTYEFCVEDRFAWCDPDPVPSPVAVTLTPPGFQLAFSSNRDGDHEIYAMKDDGSGLVQLTNNPASDFAPSWSPSGLEIAFTSNRDGDEEIYVMNADGSEVRQLTFNSGYDCCPDWSPDGSRIVFQSNMSSPEHEIYVINSDGTGLINLTNSEGDDQNPSWSPDGTKIVFNANRDGQPEIYVMNADGTDPVRMTFAHTAQRSPAWSPDGTMIAYDSDQADGQPDLKDEHSIYVMDADGTNHSKIADTPAQDRFPAWSPDSQYIVFTSTNSTTDTLWVVDRVGQHLSQLTDGGSADWRLVR